MKFKHLEKEIMRISSARRSRISRIAALTMLVLLFTQLWQPQWTSAAASDDTIPVEQFSRTFGKVTLCNGQTLRINLTYFIEEGADSSQPRPAIRAAAQLKDTSGNTIYVSSQGGGIWKTVDGGQSCSFDVKRDQLSLAGDRRSEAVAVVPELRIEVPAGVQPDFPISMEVTNDQTGAVVFVGGWGCSGYMRALDEVNTYGIAGSLCSVTRGETLQVNLTNPLPLTLGGQPVAGIDYMITIKGVAGESNGVRTGTLQPGQTIVASFNRNRLPDAGDPGTGRVSLAPEITYSFHLTPEQIAAVGEVPRFPISVEIVNSGGDTTTSLDSYYGRGILKSIDGGQTW